MNITFASNLKKSELVVVPVYEGAVSIPPELKKLSASLKKEKEFKGKEGQYVEQTPLDASLPTRVVFLGIGKKNDINATVVRNTAADALKWAKKYQTGKLAFMAPAGFEKHFSALAEGFVMANYNPALYQTGDNKKKHDKANVKGVEIVSSKKDAAAIKRGVVVAEAVNKARDLINAPHNHMDGAQLMREAKGIAKNSKLKATVLTKKQIEKLKMGAFLGVNRGSDVDANMVILEHKPRGAKGKPIVLVGKGITFDSGGYNLKSGAWFADMKMDMSGAAVVMNVLGLCGKLGINKHIIGVTPITDNLIGPKAQKVADVVTTYSGKTVEVNNTDAEGRLILCDAMAYAIDKYKPEAIIDVATLTGACMMALGEKYAGLFGNDQKLVDKLKKASDETDELAWQLPIHPDHSKEMKSRIADLQNVNYGNSGMAGASTAAAFLQEFVGKTHWAHLDIAGTAFVKHPKKYEAPMGTGYGVRLLTHFLENL